MNEARDYLELKGFDSTYWGNIIIEAEERGYFTSSNVIEGGSWVTCACGKVTSDIPRRGHQRRPEDDRLVVLGERFDGCIEDDAFLKAAKTLVRIEARATIVAKEYLQEQRA